MVKGNFIGTIVVRDNTTNNIIVKQGYIYSEFALTIDTIHKSILEQLADKAQKCGLSNNEEISIEYEIESYDENNIAHKLLNR